MSDYLKLYKTEADYNAESEKPPVSHVIEDVSVAFNKPCDPYEAVDLGLPSGTKWANKNIGACEPIDNGLYFAWGEVEGYEKGDTSITDDLAHYKWYNTSTSAYTKYAKAVDNKYALDLSDDAAYINMGSNWKMPTYEQCQELISNTTSVSVDNYNNTGKKVVLVTSKNNGNTIVFPLNSSRTGVNQLVWVWYNTCALTWNSRSENEGRVISGYSSLGDDAMMARHFRMGVRGVTR